MVARAIDELGIQDRTILISPVGCSVLAYEYFDVGNVQVAHGRAPAVATAIKRSRPESILISYQGRRRFVVDWNCGDYSCGESRRKYHGHLREQRNLQHDGRTDGAYHPVASEDRDNSFRRSAQNEGYPLHMSEMLATLDAPVYIERVGLGDNKQIAQATRAVRRALDNQVRGWAFRWSKCWRRARRSSR